MKRFYKQAEAGTAPGGYVVRLDGNVLKTPLKKTILLASLPLAEAVAAEWASQTGEIVPAHMPFTQLVNTMLDKAQGDDRREMNAQLVQYASSDLVCYFATHPQELVKRHEVLWLPLLAWLSDKWGVTLKHVSGIQYLQQDEAQLSRLEKVIQESSPAAFTALQAAAAVCGSVVIALALVSKHLTAEQAYAAACVDEIFQMEKWGADDLAQKRLDTIGAELKAVEKFLTYF